MYMVFDNFGFGWSCNETTYRSLRLAFAEYDRRKNEDPDGSVSIMNIVTGEMIKFF